MIATGPSLTSADLAWAERARGDLARVGGKVRAIAVNDAGLPGWAPWAEILYAADADWWNHHRGARDFAGERWIPYRVGGKPWSEGPKWQIAAARWGLRQVESRMAGGVSQDPARIHEGAPGTQNSAFQALGLAVLLGAARILLLGVDCRPGPAGQSHCFGDHPPELRRSSPYGDFAAAFAAAAPDLAAAGVEVINCSRDTAVTCFPQAPIEDVL